ncbi:hypothetical protein FRC01_009132 [Tulasnella sp. 417]|nr:hypothetical protein FRC01_009132 [Tulasnella sp. 417]
MAEEESTSNQPSTLKKKRYILREEARFDSVRDALPPHLKPDAIPEPLRNLSTPANDRLARFHQLADGRPPPDGLANLYFVDEMKKALKEDDIECFSHQFIRLSKDARHGYLAGVSDSTKERTTDDPSTFILFTLPSTEDTRILHGRYIYIDVPLAPLTTEDHQYRGILDSVKGRYPNGQVPCTAIAFHSFDEHLRNAVQEVTSSRPNPSTSSTQASLFPSASTANVPLHSPSEDAPGSDIEDAVVDNQIGGSLKTKVVVDRAEDVTKHHADLDTNDPVVLRRGTNSSSDHSRPRTGEAIEEAEVIHHRKTGVIKQKQAVYDPPETSSDARFDQKNSVPTSSSSISIMAEPSTLAPVPSQDPRKNTPDVLRRRKGKDRAQEPEGAARGVASIAKDLIDAKLRVRSVTSYSPGNAPDEAKRSGPPQEQPVTEIEFDDPVNAAAGSRVDECAAGSSVNHQGNRTDRDGSNMRSGKLRTPRDLSDETRVEQASSAVLNQYHLPSLSSLAPVNNRIRLASPQGNGIPQPAPNATLVSHSIDSPRVITSGDPAPDGLGLLRGWRAALLHLDAQLLAQVGLQITRPGTADKQSNEGIAIEQVRPTFLSRETLLNAHDAT